MAANIDLNDPELQKYIKMVLAGELARGQLAAPPATQRPAPGLVYRLLWAAFLTSMISAIVISAAPHAISLYLWFRSGMPVAETAVTPTARPLPTAAVSRPVPQQQPVVIIQQQPAQPAQVVATPVPEPTQAPIIIYITAQPTEPPPPPTPPPATAYPTIPNTDGWYGGGGSGWTEADETQAANESGIAHAAERAAPTTPPAPTARPEPTATAALDGWTCNGGPCPTPAGWGGGSGSGW